MKTFILSLGAILLLASCKDDKQETLNANKIMLDTTALYQGNILTDKAQADLTAESFVNPEEEGTTTTTTTVTTTTVTKRTGPLEVVEEEAPIYAKPAVRKRAPARRASRSTVGSGGSSSGTQASTPVPVRKRDKGWSAAAKGTAIGAGSGAVLGAVLSKNKVKGAVIGGVIGAGGGYAIGRAMDRKSGRVERNRQPQFTF